MTAAMEVRAHRGRSRGRTPLAVLFAVAALLIQALLPAASLAAESFGSVRIEVCTPEGATTLVLDRDGKAQKGFAGLPCSDCLAATVAVTITSALSVVPIAYSAERIVQAPTVEVVLRGARALPRPFGQGPPTQNL
ncbi:DUF2946 domain-containing protein [Phenylobacterium sp.]|uniref:DUF2946 domain-containing protein n=1 Tax=Phenylobacterium sp. TaxID=1871053 RepID=UPI00286E1D48|nr:DUF2946 domain-containing protein [Phenylobacterium sp.]